eukprot:CAMPEP_0201633768 /NCGR_PEP_ID=MMETSP0493-20130528/6965_1 /ASSEMBLY_ACC=CAM_ASM_000838 /TAXON_ID=420259 /ORGANISM="Thalassiosira gravida, Strain GMp14c1" /LENGTH=253 /DNA_ID=CAMNT_0048105521 /DNA_START=180 /DNA_END=941 /DNA_ORIENTATION=-
MKGTQNMGSDDIIGSSSVLSRMRSRKTALDATTNSGSDESDELFPKYAHNPDDLDLVTATGGGVGEFKPDEKLGLERETANVGDPQTAQMEPMNITKVLTELQAIQSQGPKKYCILGTRHCSFLHQQIVEMLAYALVLSGNHLYTSGAAGTNAAAIRGALRAFQPQLLTVVLPQSMSRQTPESQELLQDVTNVVTMPQNDAMPLDVASRICNSHLLSQTDHLISFAFHESKTVLEAAQEAQKLDMLVTLLYLD